MSTSKQLFPYPLIEWPRLEPPAKYADLIGKAYANASAKVTEECNIRNLETKMTDNEWYGYFSKRIVVEFHTEYRKLERERDNERQASHE